MMLGEEWLKKMAGTVWRTPSSSAVQLKGLELGVEIVQRGGSMLLEEWLPA